MGWQRGKAFPMAIIALYKYNKMSFVEIGAVLNVPWETVRITYMRIAVRKTIFISKGGMISNHLVTRSVPGARTPRIYSPLLMLVIRKENTHNKFNSKVTRHYALWQKRPLHYSPFGPGATIPKEVPILGSETRVQNNVFSSGSGRVRGRSIHVIREAPLPFHSRIREAPIPFHSRDRQRKISPYN